MKPIFEAIFTLLQLYVFCCCCIGLHLVGGVGVSRPIYIKLTILLFLFIGRVPK